MNDPWNPPASDVAGSANAPALAPFEVHLRWDEALEKRLSPATVLKRFWFLPLLPLFFSAARNWDVFTLVTSLAICGALVAFALWAQRRQGTGLREGQKRLTVRFDDERATFSDDEARVALPWTAFDSYRETKDALQVVSGREVRFLPKEQLSPDELELAKRWVQAKIGKTSREPGSRLGITFIVWIGLIFVFWAIYMVIKSGR